jgi:hypothetical protein
MKISIEQFDQSGAEPLQSEEEPNSKDAAMDEETLEDDVNYGIADCRRRLRSQRSTLRAQHHPPKDGSNGDVSPTGRIGSYAEVLANVSMSQSSLSRLVECLLEPASTDTASREESVEREEAVIT